MTFRCEDTMGGLLCVEVKEAGMSMMLVVLHFQLTVCSGRDRRLLTWIS